MKAPISCCARISSAISLQQQHNIETNADIRVRVRSSAVHRVQSNLARIKPRKFKSVALNFSFLLKYYAEHTLDDKDVMADHYYGNCSRLLLFQNALLIQMANNDIDEMRITLYGDYVK